MFSVDDIREIHQLFPPPTSHIGSLPSLIISSSGQTFTTVQKIFADFEVRATDGTERISVVVLAHELDVGPEVLFQLVRSQPHLALLSNNSNEIIPKSERDTIEKQLNVSLSFGLVSRKSFALRNDVDSHGLDFLLKGCGDGLIEYGDHICTKAYEETISSLVMSSINSAINNKTNIEIWPSDAKEWPGSPPIWLILHHFKHLVGLHNLQDEVFIRELPTAIRCQSKRLRENNPRAWASRLLSGEAPYFDLQVALKESPEIYDSIDEVRSAFVVQPELEVFDSFAISESWTMQYVHKSLQDLHHMGIINIAQQLREKFPASLHDHMVHRVEKLLIAAAKEKPALNIQCTGGFILTEQQYGIEKEALLEHARKSAVFQWQQFKDSPEAEMKFDISSITSKVADDRPFLVELIKDRSVERAAEEKYWSEIAQQETQNEIDFATFWSDRVDSRTIVYHEGLAAIEDAKLKDQLSDLLAIYIQKELIPDVISKARSQALVRSRKTRKNIQKLETTIGAAETEINAVVTTIDKFNKKQLVNPADAATIENTKKAMMQDMLRRLQKQQKASDGPVLFLTLVILLTAKHYSGVIYATGKFAPKLMKLLKVNLEQELYEQLEKWKEAAKAGSLSAEDRENMKKIAET